MKIKSALVTGGTGVTGNALVRYLLDSGVKVTALVRAGSVREKYLPQDDSLRIVYCGLNEYLSEDILNQLNTSEYDVFYHLAWDGSRGTQKVSNRNNYRMQITNAAYALDAVELCHALNCKTFIMTGSQAEYGDYYEPIPIKESFDRKPVNGYGMAKLCAEQMTRALCAEYGIRHIWSILFSVYGPRDATESMVDVSVRNISKNINGQYTKGEQLWNYLYSFDAAKALYLLAQFGTDGETYNVASNTNRPLCDYITEMYKALETELIPEIGAKPYPTEKKKYLVADISKLIETTSFSEEYSFDQGIKEIWQELLQE